MNQMVDPLEIQGEQRATSIALVNGAQASRRVISVVAQSRCDAKPDCASLSKRRIRGHLHVLESHLQRLGRSPVGQVRACLAGNTEDIW